MIECRKPPGMIIEGGFYYVCRITCQSYES